MSVDDYLERVGYAGDRRPTLAALRALHRRHVLSVSFENLDVQLGRPLTLDVEAAFDKIVSRGRGGWCYEQNGLFGWALDEMGFEVTRMAAAGNRRERGDTAEANHLSLLVDCPDETGGPWLADVGFGGSMLEPLPFAETEATQAPYRIGLRPLTDGRWEFWEQDDGGEFCFDFLPEPGDEEILARKCQELQIHPDSTFVKLIVVQRRRPEAHRMLRGLTLKTLTGSGAEERTLGSPDELIRTLAEDFELDVPEIGDLWPRLLARHEAYLAAQTER